jgi:hypothetical protein
LEASIAIEATVTRLRKDCWTTISRSGAFDLIIFDPNIAGLHSDQNANPRSPPEQQPAVEQIPLAPKAVLSTVLRATTMVAFYFPKKQLSACEDF